MSENTCTHLQPAAEDLDFQTMEVQYIKPASYINATSRYVTASLPPDTGAPPARLRVIAAPCGAIQPYGSERRGPTCPIALGSRQAPRGVEVVFRSWLGRRWSLGILPIVTTVIKRPKARNDALHCRRFVHVFVFYVFFSIDM